MLRALRLLPLAEAHLSSLHRCQLSYIIYAPASATCLLSACSSANTTTSQIADIIGASAAVSRRAFGSQAEVWTWGKGEEGQLGHATENLEKQPKRVDVLLYTTSSSGAEDSSKASSGSANVTPSSSTSGASQTRGVDSGSEPGGGNERQAFAGQVSCGLFHSAALLEGLLFTWGKGQGGRLGIGDDQPRYQPARVPLDDVSAVALGGLHSLAVTGDGRAWSWGFGMFGALGHGDYTNAYEPTLIRGPWENKGDRVVTISGGGAHSAAVTAAGAVYTWGRDEGEGRLGLGGAGAAGGSPTPLQVHGIEGHVVAAACGGFHTLCLTDDGRVWSFGANANGELGRESSSKGGPQPIRALEGRRIRHVACGGYHSAAVTEDGVMLTWGHGGHAQLGHGELRSERTPRELQRTGGYSRGERTETGSLGGRSH
ncbi:E3 ubiquitin-protein ligase HERC2 [Klebsormidium nitens]|uniref:E3 ubiquitin-protein ligase HERC2 n=1 Tax=Klebsormidium nitens TaxID=105231 RepID=A0A1Y1HS24_KLENI|nr:E3 ubiquitin-protein ligase HERC2 [Klebsormidium nitens]|eukprot:GAQ79376.1 E3 ubiquitin-protein ligase HERC2 [Klebsormidium nitens]